MPTKKTSRTKPVRPHILIIVENLPVPFDRRVWQQATALVRAGYAVSVICPRTDTYPTKRETIEGVKIYRHSMPPEGTNYKSYIREYRWAFLAEFFLACRIYLSHRFDVIQACNPPDNIFLIGGFFRFLFGTKFVFDHHDPFTDLCVLKFPERPRIQRLARWTERRSLQSANHVITTSEALRQLAIKRHGIPAERVTLVRSGFDLSRIRAFEPSPELKRGRQHLALYVGVMGSQDGIELLLMAIACVVHHAKRTNIHFMLVGDGPAVADVQELIARLGIAEYIEFTGFLTGDDLYRLLATATIGLCPDPKNDFNDKLSMNKVLEYMAFRLPIAMFDLTESHAIAAEAAVYAKGPAPEDLAEAMLELLDDPIERRQRGSKGYARLNEQFQWQQQEQAYLEVYRRLVGPPSA